MLWPRLRPDGTLDFAPCARVEELVAGRYGVRELPVATPAVRSGHDVLLLVPGLFLLSMLGLLIGIVMIVVLAQLAWGIIVSNFASEAFSVDAGFESSVKWLSILMAGAVVIMILLMSLLGRKFGGINLSLAAPVIFAVMGLAFYFRDSTNPFTIGWFAWSLLGCVAGFGALLLTRSPAWKLTLLLFSAFLMLTIAVPALLLATYTREDAWHPVLLVSAWISLFAPQVDAIFGRSNKEESTSLIQNNTDVILPVA